MEKREKEKLKIIRPKKQPILSYLEAELKSILKKIDFNLKTLNNENNRSQNSEN